MNEENKNNEIAVDVIVEDEYKNTEVITDIIFDGKENITLKDIEYMCKYMSDYRSCEECMLNNGHRCGYVLLLKQFGSVENLNMAILGWLKENPPTSFLMDIKTRMPNIKIDTNYNIPTMCVESLYGNGCINCKLNSTNDFDCSKIECRQCWRTPMEENSI